MFDKKVKDDNFQVQYQVLKWDDRFEDKCKNGKFDHLWQGPYKISAYCGNNTFILEDQSGIIFEKGPINCCFLKHYLT